MIDTWQSSIETSMYCPSPLRSRSSSALLERERGEERRRDVADARAGPHGPAPGLPRDAQHPAHALHDDVERGTVRVRACLPEPRHRAHYQPRVARPHRVVAEPELLHRPRTEVLDEHVRGLGQPQEQLPALRVREVDGDAALPPVDAQKVGAELLLRRLFAGRREERPVPPCGVARSRLLDLDDVGAQVGHQHRGERPRQDAREVDYAYSFQRTSHTAPSPDNR